MYKYGENVSFWQFSIQKSKAGQNVTFLQTKNNIKENTIFSYICKIE